MRLQAAFARKFCGPFSARRAGTTSARFRLCNCFYRQAGRALSVVGSHGLTTVVKQVAKFQNYNLSTFKFQCSPAWRSCSCWRCSNFARPTGFRHVGEVAFSTLLRSESRTLPDNPPLSENGAKKDRLRTERGRPLCLWKVSSSRQRPRKTKPARQYRTTGRERLFFQGMLSRRC